MIVSINQPAYLPWLGYFHRIAVSDIHVVLDDVQFAKNSFVNRNKLKTTQGWMWLTVPVLTSGRFGQKIKEVEINNTQNWRHKHLAAIQTNYSNARFFCEHSSFFEEMYSREWNYLLPLIDFSTYWLLVQLGIRTKIIRSSTLDIQGTKSELVLEICQSLGADVYLSGALGRDYLDEESFCKAGIRVVYQNYKHPIYSQLWDSFEPHMSAVDLFFNCSPRSLDIILSD